jgi:hypothetical protein
MNQKDSQDFCVEVEYDFSKPKEKYFPIFPISCPKHVVGLVGVLSTAAQNAPKAQTLPQLSGFESGIYMMPCSRREI